MTLNEEYCYYKKTRGHEIGVNTCNAQDTQHDYLKREVTQLRF